MCLAVPLPPFLGQTEAGKIDLSTVTWVGPLTARKDQQATSLQQGTTS